MYKILIVEDDEVIGRTVQNHLREWGYEAACVKDLKHVLAEFAAFEPHLVLMDIRNRRRTPSWENWGLRSL